MRKTILAIALLPMAVGCFGAAQQKLLQELAEGVTLLERAAESDNKIGRRLVDDPDNGMKDSVRAQYQGALDQNARVTATTADKIRDGLDEIAKSFDWQGVDWRDLYERIRKEVRK